MLNAKIRINLVARLKGKCPKHPRYNPELGEGRILGGCKDCLALYEAVHARDMLLSALDRFESAAQPYRVLRAPRASSPARQKETA